MTPYAKFLQSKPVLIEASEALPNDEAFAKFVERVFAARRPTLSESPAWFMFEEIGWPEGRRYCYDTMIAGDGGFEAYAHYLRILRREEQEISDRLEMRRRYWKRPTQADFLSAHSYLQELLEIHIKETNANQTVAGKAS